MTPWSRWRRSMAGCCLAVLLVAAGPAAGQVLDKQKLLDAQTFWDNRDWAWYKDNLPFFDCPDADLTTTYYYRWEVVTKHLTYGSPNTGYCFTEFIDRPFWSGTYGSISCPAGHQLYEVRWLRDPRYARDYARYWFGTPGAQPRRYSTWLADALWAVHLVHPDDAFAKGLLPDLVKNFAGWEKTHFVPAVGLFWQTGHDDGMEFNINSRQTKDLVRGAPGYRPTLNSYLWADALAIARVAELAGDRKTAAAYRARAARLKEGLKKLWDPGRQFFLPRAKQDEAKDGQTVKALSLTYQTGKYAGNPHGRELIGYVPWQFNLPDPGYEAAWKYLMDRDYFFADFGPTTVERHDPLFYLSRTCCYWSGQSWPYATTQTLKALANLLQNYRQDVITKADYYKLLKLYARTHRKQGRPYLAEAAHPDTGSWEGHDSYNHSEHYFHSGYVDLVITGLVGLRPRADDVLEVQPLAPDAWDYFALEDVAYRDRRVSVVWDRQGTRYGLGRGLHLVVDGKKLASAKGLERLTAPLPPAAPAPEAKLALVNFAVNNDGLNFPRVTASYANPKTPLNKVNDGNYWYHLSPPNRWTCEGSPHATDWCAIDFGTKRLIHTVKLYLLDDGTKVTPPERVDLEYWNGQAWLPVPGQSRSPTEPAGRRANVLRFAPLETAKVRAVFVHGKGGRTGLTEFEAWGEARLPGGGRGVRRMSLPKTLYVKTRDEWRAWLARHHASETEVWLLYYKQHTGQPRIPYDEAVEEALCFGWIDSIVKKIDDEKFAQKFTPRRARSQWSASNKRRVRRLIREGRMTEAGLAKIGPGVLDEAPPEEQGKATPALPPFVREALLANPRAWEHFQNLAPSYRRHYLAWILAAKKEETRRRRLGEAVALLEQNKKLGLK